MTFLTEGVESPLAAAGRICQDLFDGLIKHKEAIQQIGALPLHEVYQQAWEAKRSEPLCSFYLDNSVMVLVGVAAEAQQLQWLHEAYSVCA